MTLMTFKHSDLYRLLEKIILLLIVCTYVHLCWGLYKRVKLPTEASRVWDPFQLDIGGCAVSHVCWELNFGLLEGRVASAL